MLNPEKKLHESARGKLACRPSNCRAKRTLAAYRCCHLVSHFGRTDRPDVQYSHQTVALLVTLRTRLAQ